MLGNLKCVTKNAESDLYQDLNYILKDLMLSFCVDNDFCFVEEKKEITKLCLITLKQIYNDLDENLVETFIEDLFLIGFKKENQTLALNDEGDVHDSKLQINCRTEDSTICEVEKLHLQQNVCNDKTEMCNFKQNVKLIENQKKNGKSLENLRQKENIIEHDWEKEKIIEDDLEKGKPIECDLEKEKIIGHDLEKGKTIEYDLEKGKTIEYDLEKEKTIEYDLEKEKTIEYDLEKENVVEQNFKKENLVENWGEVEKVRCNAQQNGNLVGNEGTDVKHLNEQKKNLFVDQQSKRNLFVDQQSNKNLVEIENQKRKHNLMKIEQFKKLPHYKQKSKQWLDQRNDYLTASTIAAALGLLGAAARRNLLINKVSNGKVKSFFGNVATHWGNKYEPVTNQIYSYRNQIEIYEFGMITNEKYPILAVSPDGITPLRMLEIKCPYSRVIDGRIKMEYYHQMQEQMAVCEFDECDFVECKYEEVSENRFWDDFYYYDESDNLNHEKGVIISYLNCVNNSDDDLSLEYIYSPIEYHNDMEKLKLWQTTQLSELFNDTKRIYINISYWLLITYNCQLVKRNQKWIIDNYPVLESFWKEVEYYRIHGLDQFNQKMDQLNQKMDQLNQKMEQIDGSCKIDEFWGVKKKLVLDKIPSNGNNKKQVRSKVKKSKVKKSKEEAKGQCFL